MTIPGFQPAVTEHPAIHRPNVLAITADDRLYYQLLSASIDLGWRINWARNIGRALNLGAGQPIPMIVYDQDLPGAHWRDALPTIIRFPGNPAVLLASGCVNEETWENVVRSGGYDVIRRSASSEEWRRELRFAWISKSLSLDHAPG